MKPKNPKKTLRKLPPKSKKATLQVPPEPVLRFSPTAWAKLLFLRDRGPTEIGGFGISAADDLLLVEHFELVQQECSPVTVRFDDESVADFIDRQVDLGRSMERVSRIWLHTHPGESAAPSWRDEETFERVFGQVDWAVMFILARGGETYCRLRFNAGPGGSIGIPVEVDFSAEFPASDAEVWEQEYLDNVRRMRPLRTRRHRLRPDDLAGHPDDFDDEFAFCEGCAAAAHFANPGFAFDRCASAAHSVQFFV